MNVARLGEMVEQVMLRLGKVELPIPQSVALEHYSQGALSQVKPYKTPWQRGRGAETMRTGVPKAWFYRSGVTPEPQFQNLTRHSTRANLRLYDTETDPQGLVKHAADIWEESQRAAIKDKIPVDEVPNHLHVIEEAVKKLGYDGIDIPSTGVVVSFNPIPVKPELTKPSRPVEFKESKFSGALNEAVVRFHRTPDELASKVSALHDANGGSSFHPIYGDLGGEDLWSVSIFPERSKAIQGHLRQQDIKRFIHDNMDLLASNENHFVGTWHDTKADQHWLDVSVGVKDFEQARLLGEKYNQKAIFHLKTFEEFALKGDGSIPPNLAAGNLANRSAGVSHGMGTKTWEASDGRASYSVGRGGRIVAFHAEDSAAAKEAILHAVENGVQEVRVLDGTYTEAFHDAGFKAYKTEAYDLSYMPVGPNAPGMDVVWMRYDGPKRNLARWLHGKHGKYKHPGFDTQVRADDELRRYVSMGATTKQRAMRNAQAAVKEGTAAVQHRLLELIESKATPKELRAYVRLLTDVDVGDDLVSIATTWAALRVDAPFDSFIRGKSAYRPANPITRAGAFLVSAGLAGYGLTTDDNQELSLAAATLIGGSILIRPGGTGRVRKIAMRLKETELARLKEAMKSAHVSEGTKLVGIELAKPKGTPKEAPRGAELAARVGLPRQPKYVLDAFGDAALKEHIHLRAGAVENPKHLEAYVKKYFPYSQAYGSEFHNQMLSILAERVGYMNLTPGAVSSLTDKLKMWRTKEMASATQKVLDELNQLEEGLDTLHKAGLDISSDKDLTAALERLVEAGMVRVRDDLRPAPPVFREFMHMNEVLAFDQHLHYLAALQDVRETVRGRVFNFFLRKSNHHLINLKTEGERAAVHLVLLGKTAADLPDGMLHWGPRPAEMRILPGEGATLLPGERSFQVDKNFIGVRDPNKKIKPEFTENALAVARGLREEVLDPMAHLAGLEPGRALEWYFPRYYSKQTFAELEKVGLLRDDALDFVKQLDDPAFMPNEFRPRREILFRALLARKLPDMSIYMKDPSIVMQMYVQGATRRIAYEPLTKSWDEIRRIKPHYDNRAARAMGKSENTAGRMVDDWLGTLLGYNVTKSDKRLLEIIQGPKVQAFAKWLNSFEHAGMQQFGLWLSQPGAQPAQRIAGHIKGVQFMRKLGLNPGTVAINLTQPLINNYAHTDMDSMLGLFDQKDHAIVMDMFRASGTVFDQGKFEGTRDMMEHVLSGPVFGTKGRGKASGGGLLRALEIGEVFSGLPFATSEKLNNFQAFALAVMDARKGKVWKSGKGFTRGEPITDEGLLHLIGMHAARRTQFGGRGNRPSLMRDPLWGTIFQFNTFNWRMTGRIGQEVSQAKKSAKLVKQMWADAEALGKRGSLKEADALRVKASLEFWDNVMAPVKTTLALAAVSGLGVLAGLETYHAMGRVFGFLPGLDSRALAQGEFKPIDSIELGPTLGEPFNIMMRINNVRKALKDNPERAKQRIAELLSTFSPVAEVELRRAARALWDPALSDSERWYTLMGWKTSGDAALLEFFTPAEVYAPLPDATLSPLSPLDEREMPPGS